MPAVIWKVSSIIRAMLKVVRSGDARSRKYYTNCCDHYPWLSWTLQRKYIEECVIYQKKKIIKKEKIPKAWRATVDFWSKRKKKSKGPLNVEFTPRFLALRNTSMRLQKYTPSSQRFPSHFSLICLRVVFILISDKTKKQRTLASDCIFETGSLSFIRCQPSYGNLAGSIKWTGRSESS